MIPNKLKIMGKEFVIEELSASDMQGNWGFLDSKTHKLKVMKDLLESDKKDVIVHEIFHYIIKTLGYDFKYFNNNTEEEELFVLAIAPIWYSILVENGLWK